MLSFVTCVMYSCYNVLPNKCIIRGKIIVEMRKIMYRYITTLATFILQATVHYFLYRELEEASQY
jgi:hypothetical protein